MTFLSLENYKLCVFALFMVTVTYVSSTGEKQETRDIDLPRYDEVGSYGQYHFRQPVRFDQIKLIPEHFYEAITNPEYQKLPHPYNDKDFKTYQYRFRNPSEIFNLDYIEQKYLEAKECEDNRVPDKRYVSQSGNQILKTDPKYFQSNILKSEKEIVEKNYQKWNPLSEEEYQNVMSEYVLYPKVYELDAIEFSDARLQFGVLLQYIIPGITNPLPHAKNLHPIDEEVYNKMKSLILVKGEKYEEYARRVTYFEFVPLSRTLCSIYYNVDFEKHSTKDPASEVV